MFLNVSVKYAVNILSTSENINLSIFKIIDNLRETIYCLSGKVFID
jgi:hypothetical protein